MVALVIDLHVVIEEELDFKVAAISIGDRGCDRGGYSHVTSFNSLNSFRLGS